LKIQNQWPTAKKGLAKVPEIDAVAASEQYLPSHLQLMHKEFWLIRPIRAQIQVPIRFKYLIGANKEMGWKLCLWPQPKELGEVPQCQSS